MLRTKIVLSFALALMASPVAAAEDETIQLPLGISFRSYGTFSCKNTKTTPCPFDLVLGGLLVQSNSSASTKLLLNCDGSAIDFWSKIPPFIKPARWVLFEEFETGWDGMLGLLELKICPAAVGHDAYEDRQFDHILPEMRRFCAEGRQEACDDLRKRNK